MAYYCQRNLSSWKKFLIFNFWVNLFYRRKTLLLITKLHILVFTRSAQHTNYNEKRELIANILLFPKCYFVSSWQKKTLTGPERKIEFLSFRKERKRDGFSHLLPLKYNKSQHYTNDSLTHTESIIWKIILFY